MNGLKEQLGIDVGSVKETSDGLVLVACNEASSGGVATFTVSLSTGEETPETKKIGQSIYLKSSDRWVRVTLFEASANQMQVRVTYLPLNHA